MKRIIDTVIVILSRQWKLVALFAIVMTLAIAMLQSVGRSIWFDEGYSIMLAQRPVNELVALTAVDAHPPLYYLYLKAWGSLFGWSELALRMSSAVAGALAVGVMIALVRKLFSPKIAVVIVPFLVLAPFLARYNYEIRMYALVGLIGLAATWVLVTAYRSRQKKWWILYTVLVAVGMYTLYMSIVFWLAHVIWLVYKSHQDKKPIVRQRYWIYYVLAIILFLPWVPTVLYQLEYSALPPYMTAVSMTELFNVVSMFLSYNAEWQVGPWLTLGLLTVGILFVTLFGHVWRVSSSRYRQGIMLIVLGFLTGMAFYTITSLPPNPPRFMERYVLHIAMFFYAIIGIIVAIGWRVGRRVQAGMLAVSSIIIMIFGQITLYDVGNVNFQRLQKVQAKTIRQEIGCDQTTFVTSGPYGYIDMHYDFEGCDMRFYYPWEVTLTGGFAPLNGSKDLIRNTNDIMSKRIVFVYFDDSTDFMTPDARYKQVGQHDFDKTHVQIYEQ